MLCCSRGSARFMGHGSQCFLFPCYLVQRCCGSETVTRIALSSVTRPPSARGDPRPAALSITVFAHLDVAVDRSLLNTVDLQPVDVLLLSSPETRAKCCDAHRSLTRARRLATYGFGWKCAKSVIQRSLAQGLHGRKHEWPEILSCIASSSDSVTRAAARWSKLR